ncbi:Peroxisomal membrane protein PAS20, partial [Spiromyces aspiralis]
SSAYGLGGYGTGIGGYGASYGGYGAGYGGYSGYGGYGGYGMSGYGMGGYGMGSYGMGGYGMGGYGMNGPGGPMDPNAPMSLTQRLDASTRSTFQLIQSVVGAFGGFARMLESTYFATHSSFMAILGVMDQFGLLKSYMGKAANSTVAYDGFRRFWARILGRQMRVNKEDLNAEKFDEFKQRSRIRKRSLLLFFTIIIGLPYLMTKLIRSMVNNQRRLAAGEAALQQGGGGPGNAIARSGYEFAQALFDFKGESRAELTFRQGDVIAILSKTNVWGKPSEWWRGKLQDGTEGLFPSNYVKIIQPTLPVLTADTQPPSQQQQ